MGGVFGQAANALGGNEGFGDAMGLDGAADLDEMMELDGGLGGEQKAKDSKIKIKVFINMDEDDDNKHGLDLNDLFKREDTTMPFYVDVSNLFVINFLFFYPNIMPILLQTVYLLLFLIVKNKLIQPLVFCLHFT